MNGSGNHGWTQMHTTESILSILFILSLPVFRQNEQNLQNH